MNWKKLIVLALLAFFFHQNADAFRPQKPFKADISFSAAFIVEGNVLQDRFMGGYLSYDDFYRGYSPDVEHLYAEYIQVPAAADLGPMFSLRADFKVLEWLCVGVDFSYQHIWGTVYTGFNRYPERKVKGNVYYVMPEVRFDYLRTRLSTLSSSCSLGLGIYDGFKKKVYADFQLRPITYSIGTVVYGKVGVTVGTLMNGLEYGVGVRF